MAVMEAFEPSMLSEVPQRHQPLEPHRVHLRDSDEVTRCEQRLYLLRQPFLICLPPVFTRHEIIFAAATAAQVHAGSSDIHNLRRS